MRQLLEQLDEMFLALPADEAVGLTHAYRQAGFEGAPWIQTLATAARKLGNDPTTRSGDALRSGAEGLTTLAAPSAKFRAQGRRRAVTADSA